MTKKQRNCGVVDKTFNQSDDVFSCLFAVMNSAKFWRCVRLCDRGSTVLVTSPSLFEKHVLQSAEWKQHLKIKDFDSFVFQQTGFMEVLNQRSWKVQKFRHPDFKKTKMSCQLVGTRKERKIKKIKTRKANEEENAGFSDGVAVKEEHYSKDLE